MRVQEGPVLLACRVGGRIDPLAVETLRGEHPDLPVVIVTAYPDSDLMQRAAQHGPVMLLNKPVDPEQVERTIRTVLGESSIRRRFSHDG